MNFSEKVYYYCKKVPKGRITTYKELGKAMKTKAYRAIGSALSRNPYSYIPCHRVIKNNGQIGGYKGKIINSKKAKLLEKEGVRIKNNKIDLKKYLFRL